MEFTPPKYLYAQELCLLVLEKTGKGLLVAFFGAFVSVVFIGWLDFFFLCKVRRGIETFL